MNFQFAVTTSDFVTKNSFKKYLFVSYLKENVISVKRKKIKANFTKKQDQIFARMKSLFVTALI